MRTLLKVVPLVLLLLLLLPGMQVVQAQQVHPHQGGPIFGIWFYQQQDDVMIVYVDHQHDNVTDEYFGTQYTDAATQGCINQGYPPDYLVRYRQDPLLGWVVWCYSDQTAYTVIPGPVFGQDIIDAAVARAQQIVYPCPQRRKAYG